MDNTVNVKLTHAQLQLLIDSLEEHKLNVQTDFAGPPAARLRLLKSIHDMWICLGDVQALAAR